MKLEENLLKLALVLLMLSLIALGIDVILTPYVGLSMKFAMGLVSLAGIVAIGSAIKLM